MSARSFRPVIAVATVAAAALSCYLVSLRVATERTALEDVETKIVLAQRDIRTLQTEIGTRGRLEQLERWNVKVLALSAPKAEQFLDGGFQLARLARPDDGLKVDAPVVMASAPKPQPTLPVADKDDGDLPQAAAAPPVAPAPRRAEPRNDGPASLMHVASYRVTTVEEPAVSASRSAKPKSTTLPEAKPVKTPVPAAKGADAKAVKSPVKGANAKPANANVPAPTKPVKIATTSAKPSLPATPKDAKASAKPAKSGASRDSSTH